MLDTLITSKTRIKLLMKFFLNPGTKAYFRGLATEFAKELTAILANLAQTVAVVVLAVR